jgi:hypothetical protein
VRLLLPQPVEPERVVKALKVRQEKAKGNYDERARDLPPLQVGDRVRIRPNQDREWRKAEVLPRSYVVKDEQGRVYRRNRRQIISVPRDQPMIPRLKPSMTLDASPEVPQTTQMDFHPVEQPTCATMH